MKPLTKFAAAAFIVGISCINDPAENYQQHNISQNKAVSPTETVWREDQLCLDLLKKYIEPTARKAEASCGYSTKGSSDGYSAKKGACLKDVAAYHNALVFYQHLCRVK